MTHHNTIPNKVTHVHLHTPTQANPFTVATLFFSLPPNNSTQLILVMLTIWWNTVTCYKINTSPNNSKTYQRTYSHADYLSKFQFMLLRKVSLNPTTYFSMIYATIWSFLFVNCGLIFTPSSTILELTSNIQTLLAYGPSAQVLYFPVTHSTFFPYNNIQN